MEQRLPSVGAAKDKGVAGDQQVIQAENTDRRQVYAAIASETGSSADEVGRKRAAQLAELARPGHWVQGADGSWRRK
jgi:uncharacterized protein YdbL (DUF1318 family)